MTPIATLQIVLYFLLVLAIAKPMGLWLTKVFSGERTFLHPVLGWMERGTLRLLGVKEDDDQPWWAYALSLLVFSLVSIGATYALLRLQGSLPLNPKGFGGDQMPAHLAFNTSVSFATNTNWQSYSPEVSISYFSNMVALAFHNWAPAAVGMAVAVALVRGFARRNAKGIGNFWVDTLADDELESIFVKFRRGSQSRGSGFGLAICRAIVEAHRGTIHAKPRSPLGLTFAITLPKPNEAPHV